MKHQTGTLIAVDGTETPVESKKAKFSLEELQGFVGGYIELTRTNDGRDMYVNEEGKLNGLPYNHSASMLYRNGSFDPIVGPAIVIGVPRAKKAKTA